jgi:tetratricopeptide (TPR) repeat protein
MPDSPNDEAMRLEKEAREAISKRDMQVAVTSLYRAVSADPKFTRAWVVLGTFLLAQKQIDAGVDAFHKAMALDPERQAIPKTLGFALMQTARFEDAASVWRDFVKAHPDDADGQLNLGACLFEMKKYSEAITAYEAAVKLSPTRSDLQLRLGSAYIAAGDREKAGAAFVKIKEFKPDMEMLNDVAYEMANGDIQLPQALEFAKKATSEVEAESVKITLADLSLDDLRKTQRLAAYWDTLGWVDSRMSHFEEAEEYLRAAWMLTQDGMVASHLCVVEDACTRQRLPSRCAASR